MRKSEKVIILVRLFQKSIQSPCNCVKNIILINKALKHEILRPYDLRMTKNDLMVSFWAKWRISWFFIRFLARRVNSFYTYIIQFTGIFERFIIIALFLRGSFKDIGKPKTDLLELEEKVQKIEKEKRGQWPPFDY
jgi:hypothetical protein